jgi:hypothetical protein
MKFSNHLRPWTVVCDMETNACSNIAHKWQVNPKTRACGNVITSVAT